MRSVLTAAAAALLLFVFAGCTPERAATAPAQPDMIVVREFAVSPGTVRLDPSFGFSLYRGSPGVPQQQRAASVGRAAAFSLADTIVQQLNAAGYAATRAEAGAPLPPGRALVVTGQFRSIDEGRRRRVGAEYPEVAVDAEIVYQATAGAALQRLMAFPVDSRRLPRNSGIIAAGARGTDVNGAAARAGATIAGTVLQLARMNRWPGAPR